jgi:hypothetical protein
MDYAPLGGVVVARKKMVNSLLCCGLLCYVMSVVLWN